MTNPNDAELQEASLPATVLTRQLDPVTTRPLLWRLAPAQLNRRCTRARHGSTLG